jgi:hypothetical protein
LVAVIRRFIFIVVSNSRNKEWLSCVLWSSFCLPTFGRFGFTLTFQAGVRCIRVNLMSVIRGISFWRSQARAL